MRRIPVPSQTTLLDLFGVVCIALFLALVWRPEAALLVVGLAALLISWVRR